MIRRTHLFIALLGLMWAGKSFGACGLSLAVNNINVTWDLNFTSIAVQATVSRLTADACTYSIGFTKGGAASYVTRRGAVAAKLIRYQIYKDSGLTKVLKDAADVTSTDEIVEGGFQAGATPTQQTVNFYFEIPLNLATIPALVSAGTYTDTFTMNLYEEAAPPLSTVADTKNVSVTVTVQPMIALSLVDSGGAFVTGQLTKSMNFGNLAQGQSSTADLRVRTNAGFSVTFSSTNNGRLKHTTKNSYVPYSFYANGAQLNLSNSFAVPVVGLSGSGSTDTSGLAYPLKVIIGSFSFANALGGPHSDDVTITATTTE